jgi:hypothetical protein
VVSGESLQVTVHKKDLRISRDWLGGTWINIKAKPDITPTILTTNSFNTNLTMSPSLAKDADSVGFANSCHEVPAGEKSNEPDIVEEKLVCNGVAEDKVSVEDDKPPSEKSTDIEDNGSNNDKDNNENGDNKNGNTEHIDVVEVIVTSGADCKAVELMDVDV